MNNEAPQTGSRKVLKGINVTRLGELKLRAFPMEALAHALKELNAQKNIKLNDPFAFYYNLCKKYCEANNLTPKLKDAYRQIEAEGLDRYGDSYNKRDPLIWGFVEQKPKERKEGERDPRAVANASLPTPPKRPEESMESVDKNMAAIEKLAASGNEFASDILSILQCDKKKMLAPK